MIKPGLKNQLGRHFILDVTEVHRLSVALGVKEGLGFSGRERFIYDMDGTLVSILKIPAKGLDEINHRVFFRGFNDRKGNPNNKGLRLPGIDQSANAAPKRLRGMGPDGLQAPSGPGDSLTNRYPGLFFAEVETEKGGMRHLPS
jgi:hypothetical protein